MRQVTLAGSDKKTLLNELKLDRNAPADNDGFKTLKWILLAAVVGGVALALWVFGVPFGSEPVSVKTTLARVATAQSSGPSVLDATGYVVARRQATVSSKATGKVIEVLIEEGVIVTKGQLLARLDDSIPRAQYELSQSQVVAARSALTELDVQIKQAQLNFGRTEGLAQRNLASQADLDRDGLSVEGLVARLNRAQKEIIVAERSLAVQRQLLDDMEIRAPFAGVVVAKAAQPGEMISPVSAGGGFTRTGICTIVDMASLEVEVDVNESYINRVYASQPVEVVLNAYPADKFSAEVIAIIPAADRNKATVRVRVGLLERDERVLPDMGVRVAFLEQAADTTDNKEADEQALGVLVPQGAIAQDEQGQFVFVVKDDIAVRRSVRLGAPAGQRARVLTGLQIGERVVSQLSDDVLDNLRDGQNVTDLN